MKNRERFAWALSGLLVTTLLLSGCDQKQQPRSLSGYKPPDHSCTCASYWGDSAADHFADTLDDLWAIYSTRLSRSVNADTLARLSPSDCNPGKVKGSVFYPEPADHSSNCPKVRFFKTYWGSDVQTKRAQPKVDALEEEYSAQQKSRRQEEIRSKEADREWMEKQLGGGD